MSKHQYNKFKDVLGTVFVDEDGDFDPGITDSTSNSSEPVSETGQQDSMKIQLTVLTLTSMLQTHNLQYSSDTSNVPSFVFHWLLKDGEWIMFIENLAQCVLFIFNQVCQIWWL